MTKMLSLLKPLLIASYTLVFLAGLGAFSSTMGCMLDKQNSRAAKKETTQKSHMRIMNPMQVLSAKFF
jgi:hypothetical protein